jgi:hypothetical protein
MKRPRWSASGVLPLGDYFPSQVSATLVDGRHNQNVRRCDISAQISFFRVAGNNQLPVENPIAQSGKDNSKKKQSDSEIFAETLPPFAAFIVFVCVNVGLFYFIQRRHILGTVICILFFELSLVAFLYETGFPFP